MKWTLHLAVVFLFLMHGDASEKRNQKAMTLTHTPLREGTILNKTQQTVNPQDDSLTPSSIGQSASPRLIGPQENAQGFRNRRPNRRLNHPIRQGSQSRTPPIHAGPPPDGVAGQSETAPKPIHPIQTVPGSVGSLNVLASFAGKNRVLVISAPHASDGYYRLMRTLLTADVYCEMAERHMQQVVIFQGEGDSGAGGTVRRVNARGQVTEELLDPALVPRLMNFLKLEKGKFGMVLLRKTLQVEERYPYPVRLEAMYEAMDQTPIRRQEKARQRGFVKRCKAAGVEGQVVESHGKVGVTLGDGGEGNVTVDRRLVGANVVRQSRTNIQEVGTKNPVGTVVMTTKRPTTTTSKPTTAKLTTKPTTTTRRRATTTKPTTTRPTTTRATTAKPTTTRATTAKPTTTRATTAKPTTTKRTTTTTTVRKLATQRTITTAIPTTIHLTTSTPQTTLWDKALHTTTDENVHATTIDAHKKQRPAKTVGTTAGLGGNQNKYQDTTVTEYIQEVSTSPTQPITDDVDESEKKPGTDAEEEETEPEVSPPKKGKGKTGKAVGRKRTDKPAKKTKAEKKLAKAAKDGGYRGRKTGKKGALYLEKQDGDRQPETSSALASFFSSFERRRRLLVITTPSEDNRMFTQQRDEYLEHVCDMALRKVSIVTIYGLWSNGTMVIDHYQTENDHPMKGVSKQDLTNQPLIKALRKELGMTFNDYYMVLTDFDMKVKQEYEVPIAMKAVFDYIDTFSSRFKEMDHQKKHDLTCNREEKSRTLENFLSRFRWRRRLFIISAPDDEEWAYQQQLYTLASQACNLGLRHMSVLKLVGKHDVEYTGGVLELYPINGSVTVEREDVSASLVSDIRNYFQVSPEYFSMLLVGKDGNVKSWYPSPMWSMSTIYDLVDSMQLRRQEMAIQQSLGMRCPEEEYGHPGYHNDGDGHRGYGY